MERRFLRAQEKVWMENQAVWWLGHCRGSTGHMALMMSKSLCPGQGPRIAVMESVECATESAPLLKKECQPTCDWVVFMFSFTPQVPFDSVP